MRSYLPCAKLRCTTLKRSGFALLLVVFEHTTRLTGSAGVERLLAFIDVPDHAVLVDHEGGTVCEAVLFV